MNLIKGRNLIIVLLSVIAAAAILIAPVMAANTGTTEVTGTVGAYIDVTAPSAISLGNMVVGENTESSTTPGSVTCNAGSWQVTANDVKGSYTGYMTSASNVLANKFQISENGSAYSDADTGITYAGNPTSLPLYGKQVVGSGDKAGSYSITITFTGAIL